VAVGCVLATPDRCAYALTRPKVGSYLPNLEPGEDGRRGSKRATAPLRSLKIQLSALRLKLDGKVSI
jgi:hypothetical protein